MSRLLALALVAGLLLASTGAVADQDDRDGRPGRGPFPPLGGFEIEASSRSVSGEHVSFNYSEAGIADFRSRDQGLFDLEVVGEGESDDEDDGDAEGRSAGARAERNQLRVRMPNFTFTAHDGPTAASKLEADGAVTIVFEEGVVLSRENGDRVRFSFGEVTGVLRGEIVSITGRTVHVGDGALVVLDAPRGPFDDNHRELGRAIGKGHIGAEATLNLDDDEGVSEDLVSYGNVTITRVKAERGNITLLIDGHGFEGRVIVVNVDGRVLGAESADKLQILLDNASVMPASNLTDILDPDDDGFHPEYYIVFDPLAHAFQLIVTLPHYSVHTLSVTTVLVLPPPSVAIGILAGLALLVPTALVLFRRSK